MLSLACMAEERQRPTTGNNGGAASTGGSAIGGARGGTGGAVSPGTGGISLGGSGTGGAGTGGSSTGGASITDAGAGGAAQTDTRVPDSDGSTTDASGGNAIAGRLHRYLRSLRCMRLNTDPRSCFAFPEDEVKRETLTFAGATGVTYDVAVRIRGIVEPRGYTGGALQDPMNNPWFYVGGMPGGPGDNAAYNVYRINVSDPPQSYFLNRNHNGFLNSARDHDLHKIDYKVTLKIEAGAMVEIVNDDRRGSGMNNNHMKLVVDGVPPDVLMQGPNGFNGQFFYVEVESVTPAM
jgi:hypothetical protein